MTLIITYTWHQLYGHYLICHNVIIIIILWNLINYLSFNWTVSLLDLDLIMHMANEFSEAMKNTKFKEKHCFIMTHFHNWLKKTVEWMKNKYWWQKNELWIKPVLGCNNKIELDNGSSTTNYAGRRLGNEIWPKA